MSRAFVSEEAEAKRAAEVPERPVSGAVNLVTASGLAAIERHVAEIQAVLPLDDEAARPGLLRDLRYWQARRATAQVMTLPATAPETVGFGVLVTIRRGGVVSRFRIVGEDEADPGRALLSYLAPLAQSLLGVEVGELVEMEGRGSVEVLAIEG